MDNSTESKLGASIDAKKEVEPTRYYWFDSYLEFNMYNTMPSKLMDLEKRYGVSLSYIPSYDAFMAEIRKKKKEEENEMKKPTCEAKKKCFECEKRKKSESIINSHVQTECKFIRGKTKYANYPDWIKKIINTNSKLYDELKLKSKQSGVRFSNCESYEEFLNQYYEYETILDRILGW
jgi:hypothetical protein